MDKTNLASNLKGGLMQVRPRKIRDMMCSHFYKAGDKYGMAVADAVGCDMAEVRKLSANLSDK